MWFFFLSLSFYYFLQYYYSILNKNNYQDTPDNFYTEKKKKKFENKMYAYFYKPKITFKNKYTYIFISKVIFICFVT